MVRTAQRLLGLCTAVALACCSCSLVEAPERRVADGVEVVRPDDVRSEGLIEVRRRRSRDVAAPDGVARSEQLPPACAAFVEFVAAEVDLLLAIGLEDEPAAVRGSFDRVAKSAERLRDTLADPERGAASAILASSRAVSDRVVDATTPLDAHAMFLELESRTARQMAELISALSPTCPNAQRDLDDLAAVGNELSATL